MPTKDSQVVRLRNEALDLVDGLAGDSILVLAGLGPLDRSGVVTLACQLLTLVAEGLAKSDEPDLRMVTNVVPVEVLDLLYNRWLAKQDEYADLRPADVRLEGAIRTIRELCGSHDR